MHSQWNVLSNIDEDERDNFYMVVSLSNNDKIEEAENLLSKINESLS